MWDDHRRSIHKMTSPLLFSSFSIIGRNGSGCVVVPTSGSHLNFLLFFSWNRLLAQVSLSLGSFVARQDSLFHSKFFSDYAVVWLLFCFLFSSSFKGSCWYDWAAAAVCWADNKEQHASLSKRARNYKPRRCTWWHNSSIWMMMMFWWKPGRCPDQLLTTFQNRMMRL